MMSLFNDNPVKTESVVQDYPVRTAKANLGRHFTHMHYAQFSQNTTHICKLLQISGLTVVLVSFMQSIFCENMGSKCLQLNGN